MKRKFTTFIVITLICCFCSGTIVNAKEVQSKEAVFGIVNMQRGGQTPVWQRQIDSADSETEIAAQSAEPVVKSDVVQVLMVGNSLTKCSGNTTVKNLKKMAEKSGRKIAIKQLTYNNEKLSNWANPKHKNGKRLYSEIKRKKWDCIVLQEQTDSAVKNSFVKASKKICEYIRKESPKTEIIYNCTWAYKKGRRVSGKYYSFSKMQKKMNQNYKKAASQTGGRVCWSGKAFLDYRKSKGQKKNLYKWDNNHASKYGWYLNACCLYKSIFKTSPAGYKYYGNVGKKQAKKMQKIAAKRA